MWHICCLYFVYILYESCFDPFFAVSSTCFRVSTWLFIFCHLLGWSNFSHLLTPYGRLRRQKLDALLPHSASQHCCGFCTSFCKPPLNQRLMNDIAYYWTALSSHCLLLTDPHQRLLTLFKPGFFGSHVTRGGADLPPPSKNECNGWEVPKLSWNLISYQDWCQTKGFTTFGYLEPP